MSVVIPTRERPQWVVCAVKSALGQSHSLLEVIVIIDGPDTETMHALLNISDERLRLIVLRENVGGAEARNEGIRAARGEWVAFLDDDDLWMPEKLEKQMEMAATIHVTYPVISSRLLAYSEDERRILPRRLYRTGENVADYLFCRNGISYGDGMLQTSTLLTKRSLLIDVPFQRGLKRHQDWDWLLKIALRPDVEIAMQPETLTAMRVSKRNGSVSQAADWETSLAWAKTARHRMSARAYAFFIATECVPRARRCLAGPRALWRLFWECLRYGQPGLRQIALFFLFCVVPEGLRKELNSRRTQTVSTQECGEFS